MSDDALAFIERWLEENIDDTDHDAEQLAQQCLSAARDAGYTEDQVEEAASELSEDGGDLISLIEAKINTALLDSVGDEEE